MYCNFVCIQGQKLCFKGHRCFVSVQEGVLSGVPPSCSKRACKMASCRDSKQTNSGIHRNQARRTPSMYPYTYTAAFLLCWPRCWRLVPLTATTALRSTPPSQTFLLPRRPSHPCGHPSTWPPPAVSRRPPAQYHRGPAKFPHLQALQ